MMQHFQYSVFINSTGVQLMVVISLDSLQSRFGLQLGRLIKMKLAAHRFVKKNVSSIS